MPRILFHGDPHGDFDPLRKHLKEYQEHSTLDAVILVGDQYLSRPLEEELPDLESPLYWIHGNHDMHSEEQYDFSFCSPYPSLHARVEELEGVRIAGLGGIFARKTWEPPASPGANCESIRTFLENTGKGVLWRGGLPRKRREHIWPDEYEALREQRADVLVLHQAPECHPHGFKALGDLARDMGVQLVVHGHEHYPYLAKIDGGIDVLGLALAGSHVVHLP